VSIRSTSEKNIGFFMTQHKQSKTSW